MGVNAARMVEIDRYLCKENLEKYLPIYSANYIATKLFLPEFKTCAGVVIERARLLGIKSHSISQASMLKDVAKRKKQTILKKYGVENPSQSEEIKNKKINSAIKKYGCINVFQSEEIKAKSRKTMLEKYGVEYTVQLPSYKPSSGKVSQRHKEIYLYLKNNKIDCKNEVAFSKYNKHYKRTYSPRADICIESKKIVIEYNGDMWHANPTIYKKNDIIQVWGGPKTAKEIWKKDKVKKNHIESFGYKVIYVWEKDFKNNKQKALEDLLNEISKN